MSVRRKTVVTVISKIGDRKPRSEACLVVIYGQSIGHRFRLKKGEVTIGRSSQAHIQIDHESVSRQHARFSLEDAVITVEDLGSTNGTYVNDEPIESRRLHDGDLIKVGRTILKYLSNNNIEAAYHEEIYRLTTVDGLTRCANRRFYEEQLVREVSRSVRYGRALSVVCFDIDAFKGMNEEFGHLAGDAVLAQMGNRIRRRLRREDILARYGGGEFAVISPEADGAGALKLVERITRIVGEGTFGFDDIHIPVSISLGSADLSEVETDDATAGEFTGPQTQEISTGSHTANGHSSNGDTDMSTSSELALDRFALVADNLTRVARERLAEVKRSR